MMEQVQDIESRLLRELTRDQKRRDKALQMLIDRYSGRFKAFYARNGCQDAEIDDLLQDVFITVLKNAKHYRGDGPASAWLWQIARNAAHSRYRRERRHEADEFDEQVHDHADERHSEIEQQELNDCVERQFAAFASANPERAQVIAMAVHHGWKPADIARVIGRTAAATREYLSQARKVLRRFLAECFSEGDFA